MRFLLPAVVASALVTAAVSLLGPAAAAEAVSVASADGPTRGLPSGPTERTLPRLAVGDGIACAIDDVGSLSCWGSSDFGVDHAPRGTYLTVAVDERHACAINHLHRVTCWGQVYGTPPAGRFADVAVGFGRSCAIKQSDSSVVCWGLAFDTSLPKGQLTMVSASQYAACGIRPTGELACWGSMVGGAWDEIPEGQFKDVSVGPSHICAIRMNGRVVCFDDSYQTTPVPPRAMATVRAGMPHACGLRSTGRIVCWGQDDWGETKAPGGVFAEVDAGIGNACGRRPSGAIACWGYPL